MLKKKYINLHKSILSTKYFFKNTTFKYNVLKQLNFFFLSFSKKETLAVFKNIFLCLITESAVNSNYIKLHINQLFNNLCYTFSLTKSYYNILNFFKIQKLFLMLNNNHLYLSSGKLNINTFFSYIMTKSDIFVDNYLMFDVKYIQQNTYLTGKLNWQLLLKTNFSENISLSISSLLFFDILNLCSIPFYGSFLESAQVKQLLTKIK
jgi:hypothetical protein